MSPEGLRDTSLKMREMAEEELAKGEENSQSEHELRNIAADVIDNVADIKAVSNQVKKSASQYKKEIENDLELSSADKTELIKRVEETEVNTDPEISKLAADLLSTSYTLSKIFKKGGANIETEEMKLKELVPDTIIAYKRKILEIAQKDAAEKLKDSQDKKLSAEEANSLQKEFMQITSVINTISKDRGWVVFK